MEELHRIKEQWSASHRREIELYRIQDQRSCITSKSDRVSCIASKINGAALRRREIELYRIHDQWSCITLKSDQASCIASKINGAASHCIEEQWIGITSKSK
jgi:hypothetical protein